MASHVERIMSYPVRLRWAGWQTDTHVLQQSGWEIAAEQDICRGGLRLLLRSPDLRTYGITQLIQDVWYQAGMHALADMLRSMVLQVQYMACELRVNIMEQTPMTNFQQIDCTPQFVNQEIKSIEDFQIFKVAHTRSQEVLVDPKSVPELMDMILKYQSKTQAEIRDKKKRADLRGKVADSLVTPAQNFHAQIITLSDVA